MNQPFKKYISRLCLTLLALGVALTPFLLSAQGASGVVPQNAPKVSGSFEPDSIGIGDRFLYSIEVEKDLVQTIMFPNFVGVAGQQYELIEDCAVDTLERDGRRLKIRKSYLLAAFQEGWHHIVPQVMYADKNIVDTLYGPDTLDLLVTTFQIDSTSHGLFDIKPQKTLTFKLGEITGYIAWSVVALLILAALIYGLKRLLEHYGKSFNTIFKPAPPLPAHEEAFAALERLRVMRLCQEGKHKLYYSTLTDILRAYIVRRFEVSAMEMTSDEIIEAMRSVDLPKKTSIDLTMILREADLVKFAKAAPESEESEAAMRAAWEFVDATKPVEEIANEEE